MPLPVQSFARIISLPLFVRSVSGPLHREVGLIGALGATLHVAAWVVALVLDIILLTKIDGSKTTDEVHYDYWLTSFVVLIIGLVIVVVATLLHATKIMVVKEGGFAPFLMTAMTGGALIGIIFTYLLMTNSAAGLHKGLKAGTDAIADGKTAEEAAEKVADFAKEFRRLALWALLARVYIWQFIYNNQWYATISEKLRA